MTQNWSVLVIGQPEVKGAPIPIRIMDTIPLLEIYLAHRADILKVCDVVDKPSLGRASSAVINGFVHSLTVQHPYISSIRTATTFILP